MNFFVASAGSPDEDYTQDNFQRIIDSQAFALHKNTKQKGSYFDIEPNDILILKHQRRFVAYGKVIKRFINEDEFNHCASVEEWIFHNKENSEAGVSRYGIDAATIHGGKYGTVKTVESSFALLKIEQINPEHPLYHEIKLNAMNIIPTIDIEPIIKTLHYKKQIILQGPPGTGKTYTAEAIAKQLTEEDIVSNPNELLNEFYQNFDPHIADVINERRKINDLRQKFMGRFPKEELNNLSLEDYSIGTGQRDNFCWWIERGLKPLGYYFPGSSLSYRVYWSKSKDEYVKSGFVKNIEDSDQAMNMVAVELHRLVDTQDYQEAQKFFGESFILKLLNSYYPKDYMPINAINCIKNALFLFGIDVNGLDFVQLNKRLLELHHQKKKEFNSGVEMHEFMHFLFDNFNLKDGEKIDDHNVVTRGAYEIVQFHPAYSYEDFVRGIVAEVVDSQPSFTVKNKILIEFAQRAIDNPKAYFVLIIDEINRANLPAVLGELIYALEYRGKEVNSLYEYKDEGYEIKLPKNLLIIGTMNTADRSVGHIDYAIRRRFSFIDILTDPQFVPDHAREAYYQVQELFEGDLLSPDFTKETVQIGHSYFMGEKEDLEIKIKYEVVPILKEYVKDGVLLEGANKEIEQLYNSIC